MTPAGGTHRPPVHRLAWLAFGASLVAVVLAFYGSLYAEKHLAGSPLREARGSAGLPAEPKHWYERALANGETTIFGDRIDRTMVALTERSKIANYSLQAVAFVVPFLLGIASALLGGWAITLIERANGKYGGNMHGVFSIMIGMFAAVIAGCMMLSLYVWPLVPAAYTT
jgi:hypothetical protein